MNNDWRPLGFENPYKKHIPLLEKENIPEFDDLLAGVGKDAYDFDRAASEFLDNIFKIAEESPSKSFSISSNEVMKRIAESMKPNLNAYGEGMVEILKGILRMAEASPSKKFTFYIDQIRPEECHEGL